MTRQELLYKKPTAKFASCFLPAKQKRAAVTATAAAFAAAAAAKKIADKERALKNSITSGIGSSQLNVTGIEGTLDPLSDASGFKIAASISLPDTAIQIEKDTTPITALASTDNTSELPPTEAETEKALEAVVPTLHIATVAVLPDATTEMETPPLPHNPAPSEIMKKVEISHASSSSECSSDSTLTDDSSSDESDVEVEVLSTTASGSNSQGSHILQQHSSHRKELPIAGIPDTLLPSSSSRSNGAQVDQDPSSKKQKINDTRNLSLIGPISSPPDTTTKSPKKFPVNLKSDEVKKSARSARKLAKEKREIAASPTARKHPVGKAPTQLGIGKVKASSTTRARKKPVGAVAQLPQIQSGSSSIAGSAPLNAATKVTTAVVSSKQTAASKKKG